MPSIRILSHSFDCPLPYAEGHTCTASEASELNKLRTQRVSVLARKRIAESGAMAPDELQAELEKIARDYVFSAGPYKIPSDPMEHEAHQIAKAAVQVVIARKGLTLSPAEIAERVERVAQREDIRAEAHRRVERMKKVAFDALDLKDTLG